jgi:hypothetical protein
VPTQQLVRLDQLIEIWPEFGGYELRPRAVDLGVGTTRHHQAQPLQGSTAVGFKSWHGMGPAEQQDSVCRRLSDAREAAERPSGLGPAAPERWPPNRPVPSQWRLPP